jgi:hypothetical protein
VNDAHGLAITLPFELRRRRKEYGFGYDLHRRRAGIAMVVEAFTELFHHETQRNL